MQDAPVVMPSVSIRSVRPVPTGRLPTYTRRSLRVVWPAPPREEPKARGALSTHWKPSQKRLGCTEAARPTSSERQRSGAGVKHLLGHWAWAAPIRHTAAPASGWGAAAAFLRTGDGLRLGVSRRPRDGERRS